ncbi:hypothetical protein [Pedobacter nototheniae]|uniref:hypothetical protein n=1 Tax=Pedobacter nototheniae TaxID=2488994 RepID=UPI002930E651|nr:hypothetical protein [Pedobacter nototheniae]
MESKKDKARPNTGFAKNKKGDTDLDRWNDRLDENLEPENHSDVLADEKAKDFSEKFNQGKSPDQ